MDAPSAFTGYKFSGVFTPVACNVNSMRPVTGELKYKVLALAVPRLSRIMRFRISDKSTEVRISEAPASPAFLSSG